MMPRKARRMNDEEMISQVDLEAYQLSVPYCLRATSRHNDGMDPLHSLMVSLDV